MMLVQTLDLLVYGVICFGAGYGARAGLTKLDHRFRRFRW